jgi:hypothetical protein
VGVHFAAEHALELQCAHAAFQPGQLALHFGDRLGIGLRFGQFQQFQRIGDAGLGCIQLRKLGLEARTLAAEFLSAVRLAPDLGLLQVEAYLFEALFLAGVVKETP